MGWFKSAPKKTTEQQLAERYGAADARRQAEAANDRRNADLQGEAERSQRDWDARVWEYRGKCPQSDHSRCLSH